MKNKIMNFVGFTRIIFLIKGINVATLALGSRPRQGFTRLRSKKETGSVRGCEGMNPHNSKGFHFGSWSLDGLQNLQRTIAGVKTQWFEVFFISLESSWNVKV
jgi:hypothetical protein